MQRNSAPSSWRVLLAVVLLGVIAIAPGCRKKTPRNRGGDTAGTSTSEDCVDPPTEVAVSEGDVAFIILEPVSPVTVQSGGDCEATSFEISPELPDGLFLAQNGATASIEGTPLVESPATPYTILATNDNGQTPIDITIRVVQPAPTLIEYPELGAFVLDEPIDPIVPGTGGGIMDNYETDVPLPPGLNLNPTTGVISGVPTELGITTHIVTGSNFSGSVSDTIVLAIFPTTQPQGFARFDDLNRDGVAGAGDVVVITFNQDVDVLGATTDDLPLAVDGDSFGDSATVSGGVDPDEVLISLGDGATLSTRQRFDAGATGEDSSSGIAISLSGPDRIESAYTGSDAQPTPPIDLVPGFVGTGQLIGGEVLATALADVNQDGILDLITGGTGPNSVWFGSGDGTFLPTGAMLGFSTTTSIVTADFNGDGLSDLAFGNETPSGVEIWLGDGTGGFSLDAAAAAPGITTIAAADIDGDGALEIIGGNAIFEYTPGLLIFSILGAGVPATTLALSDVDGDGDLDCFYGATGGDAHLFLNDGGVFTALSQPFPADTSDVTFGDLNRDGIPDLCLAYDETAQTWLGDGTGSFTLVQDFGDLARRSVALYDVDRDGTLDAYLGDQGNQSQLWLGEGDGTFVATQSWVPGLVAASEDIDRDGDVDLLTTPLSVFGPAKVLAGSMTGTWGRAEFPTADAVNASAETLEMAVGDLDLDGDLDFIAARLDYSAGGAPNRVYLNDGTGTFVETADELGLANTKDIALLDVDRDGDLDLFSANAAAPNALYLNDGNGSFTASTSTFPTDNTTCMAVADFNADGIADVAVGNWGMNFVYFGDGAGGLVDSAQTLFADFSGYTLDLVVIDLDRDGDLDIIEGTSLGRHNMTWINDGAGQFSPAAMEFGFMEVQAVTAGDVNRDGNPDLVLGRAGVGSAFANTVLLGDGAGGFTEGFVFPTADITTGLSLADVDEDGDLDLFVANVGDNLLYMNDGEGNYTESTVVGAGSTSSVQSADFDRDGDIDFLVGNRDSEDRLSRNQ